MARETTKWPSTRWPITKIMSSDGCNGNRVPLEMGPWYDFREFGCHLGNVGPERAGAARADPLSRLDPSSRTLRSRDPTTGSPSPSRLDQPTCDTHNRRNCSVNRNRHCLKVVDRFRLTFDQGRDVAVLRSRQQITFPVTRHRPIFDRGRALTDRHHVRDLTPANAFPVRLFRASDRALRPKMLKQLLLKHTAGLNKQTAIDRLVRHLIRPSSWMRSLEPSGDRCCHGNWLVSAAGGE